MLAALLLLASGVTTIVLPKDGVPLMHHHDSEPPDYDCLQEPEVIEHTRDVAPGEFIDIPYQKYSVKRNRNIQGKKSNPTIPPLYPQLVPEASEDDQEYDSEYDEDEDAPDSSGEMMTRVPSQYRIVRYRPRQRPIRLVRKRPNRMIYMRLPKRRPHRLYLPSASTKRRRVVCDAESRGGRYYPENNLCKTSPLEVVAAWSFLSFASEEGKKSRVLDNAVFTGLSKWGERLFISVPRFKHGIPATLTWMPVKPRKKYLRPFPDWNWQRGHINNCSGLVSVFRTRMDTCGRLWVLDSGTIDSEQICPPRLLTFNIRTHELISSFTFPSRVLRYHSLLTFFVIDNESHSKHCDNLIIYVSDSVEFGLIVFDVQKNKVWRFEHETFAMKPEYSTYTVAGESSNTEDGIIGMTVAQVNSEKFLFYQSFAGVTMYAIPTSALRRAGASLPVMTVMDKISPGIALASDSRGFIYFSPLSETSLMAMETNSGKERVLLTDETRLQFVSDITVDSQGDLWLMSNRFQSFKHHSYDPDDMNFRIMRLPSKHPMFRVNRSRSYDDDDDDEY